MLCATLDRISAVVASEDTITVIGKGHGTYLQGCRPLVGTVVEQPESRGTAVGILFPLARILAQDPEVVVLITPSDHFVSPAPPFQRRLERALRVASAWRDRVVLLAAKPRPDDVDYGWIEPGPPDAAHPGVFSVRSFREKPSHLESVLFRKRGWLLNTMIVAARAHTLWRLLEERLPRLVHEFRLLLNRYRQEGRMASKIGGTGELERSIYSRLDSADFSRDVLEPAARSCVVLRLERVEWSDWGRPERILDSLNRPHRRHLGTAELRRALEETV